MSTFGCPIVEIGKVGKHPNADTLSITEVEGCPVIFRTGDYKPGDYAIYVPVDSVVPVTRDVFAFLATKEFQKTARVKAKKLRGIFSMGLLVPISAVGEARDDLGKPILIEHRAGENVANDLGVVKYEEPEENMKQGGKVERDPGFCPIYDIESYRKYKRVFHPGEQVVVTEKIHGCNARFAFRAVGEEPARLFVGSHKQFKKEGEDVWWKVARQYKLAEVMASPKLSGRVLYGEVYGQVQDLKYGTSKEDPLRFRAFDIYDTQIGRFLDWSEVKNICTEFLIPIVPVLYEGPYDANVIDPMAEGKSSIADQIKEGFVIKPVVERWERSTGRVILKLVSEQYLLRKDGTEHH